MNEHTFYTYFAIYAWSLVLLVIGTIIFLKQKINTQEEKMVNLSTEIMDLLYHISIGKPIKIDKAKCEYIDNKNIKHEEYRYTVNTDYEETPKDTKHNGKPVTFSANDINKMIRLYRDTTTGVEQIANEFNISRAVMYKLLDAYDIPRRQKAPAKSQQQTQIIISEEDKAKKEKEIINSYLNTFKTIRQIAEEANKTSRQVDTVLKKYGIARNRTKKLT